MTTNTATAWTATHYVQHHLNTAGVDMWVTVDTANDTATFIYAHEGGTGTFSGTTAEMWAKARDAEGKAEDRVALALI